jgi:hypothetical protein
VGYKQLPADAPKVGKQNQDAFKQDPAIDNLIKAKTCPHWKGCYQGPIKVYFGSDKMGAF